MPLSWNEIRHRAIAFSKEWRGETREAAERQSFWNEFFNVFGIRRRTVATFEEPVKKLSGDWGFIDLFWPGRLLAEHKSAGEDLGKAHAQGMACPSHVPVGERSPRQSACSRCYHRLWRVGCLRQVHHRLRH
jgi:hypothetical protein